MQHETRMAIAGLRLKSTPEDVRSLPLTENVTVIDGETVSVLATGETCGKAAANATGFGVVVFQHIGKSGRTADGKAEAYIQHDTLPVMTQGRIWVKPNEAITARGTAAAVYVNVADGTLGQTAESGTLVPNAYWDVPTNSDGLAVVHLG
ncbi:hypothetical protein PSYG_00048 [Psychrobacter phage pOW20-A]|uniref:virion structural protein n=1 Tax=Psychrobacter phage pOW20-A TaxID=754048 RepID=UPI0002C18FD7|nr:virion structural protein [Psychrobacter phage pOW20-A]AGH57509.1 hypothetical protein PSYG_00048 [Psychrobacter phage pOW20-A]